MSRTTTVDEWAMSKDLIPGCKGKRGPRSNNRRFLNALLWMARSGGRWSDLPKQFGEPTAVKQRYFAQPSERRPSVRVSGLARRSDQRFD